MQCTGELQGSTGAVRRCDAGKPWCSVQGRCWVLQAAGLQIGGCLPLTPHLLLHTLPFTPCCCPHPVAALTLTAVHPAAAPTLLLQHRLHAAGI